MEGTVKWFNVRKGFGFVNGDDGEDYFVHYTSVEKGTFIRENDRVSFESATTDKGKQAQDVKLLQKGSERTDIDESEDAESEAEEEQEEE
ncbi:MAG: cold shock domain-containing protein [Candidatus Woesearchaeota archaeon]